MGRWSWSTDAWGFLPRRLPRFVHRQWLYLGPGRSRRLQLFLAASGGKIAAKRDPLGDDEARVERDNEAIRSDATWNGLERNVFYRNNQDGTFTEVSGIVGLDFLDDSRTFALADIDHDGRLEIILKNRTAPQIRILHNAMDGMGSSMALRMQGTKSNRDAIGAAVTIESARPSPDQVFAGRFGLCYNTARSFSSGWETQKTRCAPRFAGPVA